VFSKSPKRPKLRQPKFWRGSNFGQIPSLGRIYIQVSLSVPLKELSLRLRSQNRIRPLTSLESDNDFRLDDVSDLRGSDYKVLDLILKVKVGHGAVSQSLASPLCRSRSPANRKMLTEADKGAEMEGAEGGRWMKRKRAEGTRGEKQEQQYRGGGKRAGGVREWGSAGGREVYPSTRTID
jgi:hypothetical protein